MSAKIDRAGGKCRRAATNATVTTQEPHPVAESAVWAYLQAHLRSSMPFWLLHNTRHEAAVPIIRDFKTILTRKKVTWCRRESVCMPTAEARSRSAAVRVARGGKFNQKISLQHGNILVKACKTSIWGRRLPGDGLVTSW